MYPKNNNNKITQNQKNYAYIRYIHYKKLQYNRFTRKR